MRNFVFTAERLIKPVALGRKNWNVSGSAAGAESSCSMYTLLQTAMLNGHDPGAYLYYVVETVTPLVDKPYTGNEQKWEGLLPWNVDPQSLFWKSRIKNT